VRQTSIGLVFLAAAVVVYGSCAREPCQKLSHARQARQDPEQALFEDNLEPRPRCTPAELGCGPIDEAEFCGCIQGECAFFRQ
jgi:hypothetical protein